jgi:hypothetical protein
MERTKMWANLGLPVIAHSQLSIETRAMNCPLSLAPGFSPVLAVGRLKNRFNGFPAANKLLKRLLTRAAALPG